MKIIYKHENKNEFLKGWSEFLNDNLASFKYLPLRLNYDLLYSKHIIEDKSFVVIENNKCVGICFLPVENINLYNSISIAGGYTIVPLSVNSRVEKIIFNEIFKIAQELNVKKIKFFLDSLIMEYKNKFNYLLEYGFIDTTSSNCIVELEKSKEDLWTSLRKSYKPLINGILKDSNFDFFIMDYKNPDYKIHEIYRKLHKKCARKITRRKETFDIQFEMLKNDFASLLGLKHNGKFIGMGYFFHYKKGAVYASGADDPDYEDSKIPIYHAILWKAILYYKKRGCEYLEYSQPCGFSKVQGFDDYMDEKQINISLFKRGMASKMVPLFRGIKYFDNNLLIEEIEEFKRRIL